MHNQADAAIRFSMTIDPSCGATEVCSNPAFVTVNKGSIKQETVVLPFCNLVSHCSFKIQL